MFEFSILEPTSIQSLIQQYGFLAIVLGSLIVEDATLVLSVGLVQAGALPSEMVFLANFIGITLGDSGLYTLGRLAQSTKLRQRFAKLDKVAAKAHTVAKQVTPLFRAFTLIACRFLPGTRIPTYAAAGFVSYPLVAFLLITSITVVVWVKMAFLFGSVGAEMFEMHPLLGAISMGTIILVFFLTSRWLSQHKIFNR